MAQPVAGLAVGRGDACAIDVQAWRPERRLAAVPRELPGRAVALWSQAERNSRKTALVSTGRECKRFMAKSGECGSRRQYYGKVILKTTEKGTKRFSPVGELHSIRFSGRCIGGGRVNPRRNELQKNGHEGRFSVTGRGERIYSGHPALRPCGAVVASLLRSNSLPTNL